MANGPLLGANIVNKLPSRSIVSVPTPVTLLAIGIKGLGIIKLHLPQIPF